MALSGAPGPGRMAALGAWCYLSLGAAGVALALIFGRWEQVARLARGSWTPAAQAAGGAALALGLVLCSRLLTAALPAARRLERALAGLIGPLGAGELLLLAGLSGLVEEFFFRAVLLDLAGPLWSTLLFALLHCGPGRLFLLWTLMAGAAGALFAWLALDGSGLLALALAHAGLNAVNLRRLSRIAAGA